MVFTLRDKSRQDRSTWHKLKFRLLIVFYSKQKPICIEDLTTKTSALSVDNEKKIYEGPIEGSVSIN